MVIAVLVSQFAPSSRGLEINDGNRERSNWSTRNRISDAHSDRTDPSSVSAMSSRSTRRRKPFRAMAALTSLASDLDVISDWVFYTDTVANDKERRNEWQENPDPNELPYLIPPWMLGLLFVICIVGTLMWLILATDGRAVAVLFRRFGFDKLSMGHMLFLCVVLEDIPQVIMTFMIEDYYEDPDLSGFAVLSLTMSLYDTLIKLAEAYDERNDVVETGQYCKESLWAHHDVISSVLSLPLPPSTHDTLWSSGNSMAGSLSSAERVVQVDTGGKEIKERPRLRRQSASFIDHALMPIAPYQLPRLRFLSAALDRTIRLWDTYASSKGHRRDKCIHVFRGHTDGVTCIALLGKAEGYDFGESLNLDDRDEEYDHTTCFVTGCRSGNAKLWNLRGDCIRSFYPLSGEERNGRGVTCINVIKTGSTFVCGYEDGSARLWEAWSGICVAVYAGHQGRINSVCSMLDDISFLTSSDDNTIKLWKTTQAMTTFQKVVDQQNASDRPDAAARFFDDETIHQEMICEKTFQIESDPCAILCTACVEKGVAFMSGSVDSIARLWSVETGACLRQLWGHQGPVSAVAVVDNLTVLTGSHDGTIKVWDAISARCLRTYDGHKGKVTSISMTHDPHTFLSASADRTVKMWVMTSVPKKSEESLDDLLDMQDGLCHCGAEP